MDLAGWRRTQTEPDPRGGRKQLTQRTLAARIGINPQHLCRVERGERWSEAVVGLVWDRITEPLPYEDFVAAQLRTWRAYDPSRKGKRP